MQQHCRRRTWPCRPPLSAASTMACCRVSAAASISPCCQLPAQRIRLSHRSQEDSGMDSATPALRRQAGSQAGRQFRMMASHAAHQLATTPHQYCSATGAAEAAWHHARRASPPGGPSGTGTICSRRCTAAPLSASTAAARCSLRPAGAAGTAGMPDASNCSDRVRLVVMVPAARMRVCVCVGGKPPGPKPCAWLDLSVWPPLELSGNTCNMYLEHPQPPFQLTAKLAG